MSIYSKVYNDFIKRVGPPTSKESLDQYINFVISNKLEEKLQDIYCEDHHIIPRCLYENDLVFTLTYTDHVEAHLFLVRAYPILMFIRPLNFMLSRKEKDFRKYYSIAVKTAWVNFRKTEKYHEWLEKRKKYGKSADNRKTLAIMNERSNTPEARKKRSETLKKWWTPERRKQKSIDLIEYNRINGTERYTNGMLKRWNDISEEDYKSFCDTMKKVNNCEEKRKISGDKIKNLWENDPDYQEKMAKRRKRGSDGTKSKKNWEDPAFKEKVLKSRKLALIRKNIPEKLALELKNLSDDEIIENYGKYTSRYADEKCIPNLQLKNRIEVHIIKEYKKQFSIRKCKHAKNGWYRFNKEKLDNIIKIYYNKYGTLKNYDIEIEGIINETY